MLILCIIFTVLGLICLLAEATMPGFGIAGITGLVLLAVSAVLAVIFLPFGLYFVSAELILLFGVGAFFFYYIKKKQWHGRIIMDETLKEDTDDIIDTDSLIGREGVCLTQLRPVGEVDFNGVRLEASSVGKFIDKGVRVRVVDAQKGKITVTQLQ